MTPDERDTYHTVYDRWLSTQEPTARRTVLVGMRVMQQRIQNRLKAGQSIEAVINLLPTLITEADHAAILSAIYLSVGVAAAQREFLRLTGEKSEDGALLHKDRESPSLPLIAARTPPTATPVSFFSEVWRQRMVAMMNLSPTAMRITEMTIHTRIIIRDVLRRSVDRRWSIPETVKRIAGVLGGGGKARKRARLIALTETTRAANAGHEAGALSTNITLEKVWIATADTRTRDAHRAMLNSKPIGPNDLFSVGSKKMRYPGDPSGGAANCCRCRCTIAYIPKEEI